MINKLQTKWTFWFDKLDSMTIDDDWEQFLIKTYTFEDAENFWNFFNNIIPPQYLQNGASFYLFKSNIEPKWEDEKNAGGGRWVLVIHKQFHYLANLLWEKTLILIISEQFKNSQKSYINGAVLNMKKSVIKIAIWTKNADNKEIQIRIGKFWKQIIKTNISKKNFKIDYFPHSTFICKNKGR